MKWICDKCKAINPQFSYKCHNCKADIPFPCVEVITKSSAGSVVLSEIGIVNDIPIIGRKNQKVNDDTSGF